MSFEIEQAKDLRTVTKSFVEIIDAFMTPKGIDAALLEGHKTIIDRAAKGESVDEDAFAFLCGYKKLIKEYKNSRNAVESAKKYLKEDAAPHSLEEDWLNMYFDKVRLVSNDMTREVWAKILAEETNRPGCISPSLLHALSIMSKEQAQCFSKISRFCWRVYKKEDVCPLIFLSSNEEAYKNSNIDHKKLRELERLGLIDCEFLEEYALFGKIDFVYGNHLITVLGDPDNNAKIKVGNVVLTKDGEALYSIISDEVSKFKKGILEFTISRLRTRNCQVFIDEKKIL